MTVNMEGDLGVKTCSILFCEPKHGRDGIHAMSLKTLKRSWGGGQRWLYVFLFSG